MTTPLSSARRIVIKIGSALLVDRQLGLRKAWLENVAADLAKLGNEGKEIVIVSSGAIALGSHLLGLHQRPSQLHGAQAAACVGQISLMNAYQSSFAAHGKKVGQLLLTMSDLDGRRTYLNARDTVRMMVKSGIIPIINENDATATEEIRVGDNDRLAARVAQMLDADLLVLLSDVDGLYSANPSKDQNAVHYPVIEAITPDVLKLADEADDSAMSRGGMATKLEAGRIASDCGCAMIIMNGKADKPLSRLESGERHSLFKASAVNKLDAWSLWLAGQFGEQGSITIDDGAVRALNDGNSLLAAGITGLDPSFLRGDVITVFDSKGTEIARGLVNYHGAEVTRIKGLKSDDIEAKLGYMRNQTVIHRDNMVLTRQLEEIK